VVVVALRLEVVGLVMGAVIGAVMVDLRLMVSLRNWVKGPEEGRRGAYRMSVTTSPRGSVVSDSMMVFPSSSMTVSL